MTTDTSVEAPPPAWDPKSIASIRMLEQMGAQVGLVARMVTMCLEQTPARLATIRGAVEAEAWDDAAAAAHALVSSSGTLGAALVAHHARALEGLCLADAPNPQQIIARERALIRAWDDVRPRLEALCAEG